MRDALLKEAIADAKAIRDAAIAQAKMSLEESFKPHLSSMLSARLRSELNENNDDSSEIAGSTVTVKNPGPKEPSKATSDSSHIENPGLETDTLGEAFGEDEQLPPVDGQDTPLDAPDMGGAPAGMDGAPSPEMAGAPAPDMGGLDGGMEGGMGGEGDAFGGDELDLDAIIRELELDLQGGEGAEAPQAAAPAPVAPEMEQPVEESFSDAQAGKKVTGPLDGSNIQETVSGDGDEGVHKDGHALPAKDGVNGGKEVKPGQTVTGTAAETMTEGEEVDLEEILREMEADDSPTERSGYVVAESEKIALENVELKRTLREYQEALKTIRGQMNEVNLLNSKLLFTNKLFKNYNLNMNQKVRVVETFDRASNVREVKLIYTTLAENFNGKIGNVSKKGASAKTITEGMASKSTGSTKPKSQPVLAEGNDLVARMQKLAGIKLS